MNDKKTYSAHAAILLANVIFGLGVPVTKFLLDEWVTPMTYMASRCLGATIIFWVVSWFLPKEHVERRDLLVIMAGGLTGFVISQTLTAWALQFTTPVYFSLIATLTPIATMLMADGVRRVEGRSRQQRPAGHHAGLAECAHVGGLPAHHKKGVAEIHRGDTDEVDFPRLHHCRAAFLVE